VTGALADGEASTPKSGHGRTVDMSQELVATLQRLKTDRKAETLRRGWGEMPARVFCAETATALPGGQRPARVRK
jgi:hypothetical protein